LLCQSEIVQLSARQVLGFPDQPLRSVYFLRSGVVALLVPMSDGRAIESATVGCEGVVGFQVYLGDQTETHESVQVVPGEAVRTPAVTFRDLTRKSALLQSTLHRYTLGLMAQLARTAGCNRAHSVDQRVARWLLLSCDRMVNHRFPLTHELLAMVLGVRRASVTESVARLQDSGVIAYGRGWIEVSDRERLEAITCEDYRLSHNAYQRMAGCTIWR
jgi:CRP-like cAMP-binding protein